MFADVADQAVPCNNNSSSGCAALLQEVASMLGARRKSERERERGKNRTQGFQGVAQGADDVVVMHSKTLLLSLSSQQRTGLEEKQYPAQEEGERGRSVGRTRVVSCVFPFA